MLNTICVDAGACAVGAPGVDVVASQANIRFFQASHFGGRGSLGDLGGGFV
jgi:hypothetical protein